MGKARHARDAHTIADLPNIGPAMIEDFRNIGIEQPQQLAVKDPYALYDLLCRVTGVRHDPCVLDTFISAVRFMQGAPPHAWWHYTAERKARFTKGG